jgi:hypothetical protein
MSGHSITLIVSAGVLLAGAGWIWFRYDAPIFKKAEATFLLSVSILWTGAITGQYGSIRAPARRLAPHEEKIAFPEETTPRAPLRYGPWTAVYDIAAHTVYLPNGKKLEAHSGLGHGRDDPRSVSQTMRGATPPNVYELVPLTELFHGVPALHLVPVGNDSVFGRTGFLAHSYMLGPRGDSHGCVVFKDYNSFLQAFRNGEIKRLVVVAHLD